MIWYTGDIIYDTILLAAFAFTVVTIIAGFFYQTPYGRFGDDGFGIKLNPRLGWFLMELPATVSFLYFYFNGSRFDQLVPIIFLVVWLIHYANRGFIFPFLIRVHKGRKRNFNLLVVSIGIIVTTSHGYFNGKFITDYSQHFTDAWLSDPRFIVGILIYYAGFILTIHSDAILRNLRPKDEAELVNRKRYQIPYGGAFRWLSNPNYSGELLGWAGFAIATWSLAGLFIFSISVANLLPRALATHKWYCQTFQDYPANRKILIPYLF